MSSQFGRALRVQIFGESHGACVGVTVEGFPAGFILDEEKLYAFLQRRAAKGSAIATGRVEADLPRIVSGIYQGKTTGQPVTALFDNKDTHSADYAFLPATPRPGHADYPATVKSGGFDDLRGSGHHSGRLTLPYAYAGGLAKQFLYKKGIRVYAHILRIGSLQGVALSPTEPNEEALQQAAERAVCALSLQTADAMQQEIVRIRQSGDSVGGVVECVALGVPAGLGAPFFEGVEAMAAAHMFSIPAVKGVEFGAGFAAADMCGSRYNDAYCWKEGVVQTTSNHSGGLLGGLTSGMPVLARVAFRPTPSIGLPQKTVSLLSKEEATLCVKGRHDPCVVVRAVPVVEAAMALSLCDLWLQRYGDAPLGEGQDDA